MATYKSIKGFKVQTLASDPLVAGIAGATWSSGGDLNTACSDGGAAGTSTLGLAFRFGTNEGWNGSSWTEINNVANGLVEIATTTSSPASLSIKIGGTGASNLTEEWTAPDFVIKTLSS